MAKQNDTHLYTGSNTNPAGTPQERICHAKNTDTVPEGLKKSPRLRRRFVLTPTTDIPTPYRKSRSTPQRQSVKKKARRNGKHKINAVLP